MELNPDWSDAFSVVTPPRNDGDAFKVRTWIPFCCVFATARAQGWIPMKIVSSGGQNLSCWFDVNVYNKLFLPRDHCCMCRASCFSNPNDESFHFIYILWRCSVEKHIEKRMDWRKQLCNKPWRNKHVIVFSQSLYFLSASCFFLYCPSFTYRENAPVPWRTGECFKCTHWGYHVSLVSQWWERIVCVLLGIVQMKNSILPYLPWENLIEEKRKCINRRTRWITVSFSALSATAVSCTSSNILVLFVGVKCQEWEYSATLAGVLDKSRNRLGWTQFCGAKFKATPHRRRSWWKRVFFAKGWKIQVQKL